VSVRLNTDFEKLPMTSGGSLMPAAPGALRRDLQAALDLLLIQPDIGCQVPKASSPGVRRLLLPTEN
jgi:hypothetical protein